MVDGLKQKLLDRSGQLLAELQLANYRKIDRMFVWLMVIQWLAGIATAIIVSPYTWIGSSALVHVHVWAAVLLGGLISFAPILLGLLLPGRPVTRHVIAVSQALWGALLIHLSGGRLETHFHIFGSLAFIAFYRDWKVLLTMSLVVALDHAIRGIFFPLSVYGVVFESPFRWIEHTAWVVLEDIVLLLSIQRGHREANCLCDKQVELEEMSAQFEQRVIERSRELKDTKDFFQSIMDSVEAHICVLDRSGVIVETNAVWESFAAENEGCSVGIGANYLDACRAASGTCMESASEIADAIEQVIAGKLPQYVAEHARHFADDKKWYQLHITPLRNHQRGAAVVSHTDVTERVAAEQDLAGASQHLELLSLVAKYTDNAVVITDSDGIIEWVNEGFVRTSGYTLQEVEGKSPGHVLHGENTDSAAVVEMNHRLDNKQGFDVEIVNYSKSGEAYWVAIEVRPIYDNATGQVVKFIWIENDITVKRQQEQSMRLLREAVDHATDAMFVIKSDLNILDVNETATRKLGYSREEFLQMTVHDIDGTSADSSSQERWKQLESQHGALIQEKYKTKDGAVFPVEISPAFVRQDGQEFVCAFARDITERIAAERDRERLNKDIQNAARRAGMAEVATGILHNVGNVLNSLNVSVNVIRERVASSPVKQLARAIKMIEAHKHDLGNFLTHDARGKHFPSFLSQLASTLTAERDTQMEEVEAIAQSVQSIKEIVCMQQAFADQKPKAKELVDPITLLDDAIKLNEETLQRHSIKIIRDFATVPRIFTKRHDVVQILASLITNARQAMENSALQDRCLLLAAKQEGDSVRLEVSDSGVGLSTEDRDKVFQQGNAVGDNGYGLRLHSCALTAQELGGGIEVHSIGLGAGSTVSFRLPANANEQQSEMPLDERSDQLLSIGIELPGDTTLETPTC